MFPLTAARRPPKSLLSWTERQQDSETMAIHVFGFECATSGATVIVERTPLTPRCVSDSEIDYNIQLLKDNLDVVATEMKRAIREQAKKSDF